MPSLFPIASKSIILLFWICCMIAFRDYISSAVYFNISAEKSVIVRVCDLLWAAIFIDSLSILQQGSKKVSRRCSMSRIRIEIMGLYFMRGNPIVTQFSIVSRAYFVICSLRVRVDWKISATNVSCSRIFSLTFIFIPCFMPLLLLSYYAILPSKINPFWSCVRLTPMNLTISPMRLGQSSRQRTTAISEADEQSLWIVGPLNDEDWSWANKKFLRKFNWSFSKWDTSFSSFWCRICAPKRWWTTFELNVIISYFTSKLPE